MDFRNINEGHEDGEEPIVFHYNREERIRNAPDLVKQYYAGELKRPRGLFRVLVSNKANKTLLFVLVVCFILVGFIGFFGPKKNESAVSGVSFNLLAFSYDDTVYASLKFSEPDKKNRENYSENIPLKVRFSFFDADNMCIVFDEVNGSYNGKEVFLRTSCRDYDIFNVTAEFDFCDEEVKLQASVEHR